MAEVKKRRVTCPYAYDFGRAVAHYLRKDFDMAAFSTLFCETTRYRAGSNAERDAMIGAFDEYRRLVEIDREFEDLRSASMTGVARDCRSPTGSSFGSVTTSTIRHRMLHSRWTSPKQR